MLGDGGVHVGREASGGGGGRAWPLKYLGENGGRRRWFGGRRGRVRPPALVIPLPLPVPVIRRPVGEKTRVRQIIYYKPACFVTFRGWPAKSHPQQCLASNPVNHSKPQHSHFAFSSTRKDIAIESLTAGTSKSRKKVAGPWPLKWTLNN